jgi:hypothetical protein
MSKHIMDNYVISDWYRLTDSAMFNVIPFGVYALTEPTDSIPPSSVAPFEYDRTVYFGKSGTSYHNFFHDRKRVVKLFTGSSDLTEKEYFYKYSLPGRRLKSHRHNIVNNNTDIEREISYQKFFENFGYGKDVASRVNVCMITPQFEVPNHSVKAWLTAMESYMILRFQYNFGRNTLMNVDHDLTHNRTIEDSHANRKSEYVRTNSLVNFLE